MFGAIARAAAAANAKPASGVPGITRFLGFAGERRRRLWGVKVWREELGAMCASRPEGSNASLLASRGRSLPALYTPSPLPGALPFWVFSPAVAPHLPLDLLLDVHVCGAVLPAAVGCRSFRCAPAPTLQDALLPGLLSAAHSAARGSSWLPAAHGGLMPHCCHAAHLVMVVGRLCASRGGRRRPGCCLNIPPHATPPLRRCCPTPGCCKWVTEPPSCRSLAACTGGWR